MIEWMPGIKRLDGPAEKAGYPSLFLPGWQKLGSADHSAEGGINGAKSVLFGPSRASWQFTIGYSWEDSFQHYSILSYCWHAGDIGDDGGVRANIQLIGKEHLGRVGEPLTDFQVELSCMIDEFCAEQFNRQSKFVRYTDPVLLFDQWWLVEHNEVSDVPTSCPSDRIPWERKLERLNGGSPMTPAEKADYEAFKDGARTLALATLKQVNENRQAIYGLAGGFLAIKAALESLSERVDNTIGGNVEQVTKARQAIATIACVVEDLEAKRDVDRQQLEAAADTLKAFAEQ